jgi:pilus assembly protein CpaB
MTRRRRAAALLGLALLLGVLAASDVAGREAALRERLGPTVSVVVVREPVAAGARITARVLGTRAVPARYAPPGALRNPAQAIGRRAAVVLGPGTDLDPALLQVPGASAAGRAPPLRRGERALDVIAVAQPDSVIAGARVDVLATDDGRGEAAGATGIVLEDAEVLDSAPAPPAEAGAAAATAGLPRVRASLRVGVRQAVALAGALSAAREVRLLPRPQG